VQKRKRGQTNLNLVAGLILAIIGAAVLGIMMVNRNRPAPPPESVLPPYTPPAIMQGYYPGQRLMLDVPLTLYRNPEPGGAVQIPLAAGTVVRVMNIPLLNEHGQWLRIFSDMGRGWLPVTWEGKTAVTAPEVSHSAETDESPGAIFRRATAAWAAENAASATFLFNAVLERQPDHADSLFYLGVIADHENDSAAALDYLAQAIAAAPDRAAYYRFRAVVYTDMHDFAAAQADLTQALELVSDYASAHFSQGYLRSISGGDSQAAYRQALALDPAFDVALRNMGKDTEAAGNPNQAMELYLQALTINPYFTEVYNDLGLIYLNRREYDLAYTCFTRAIETNGVHIRSRARSHPYINRATILIERGENGAALADLVKSQEFNPDDGKLWYNMGVNFERLDRFNEALNAYTQALAYHADNPQAVYYNRGITHYKVREYERAVEDFNAAIDFVPDWWAAIEWRGNAYDELGQYDLAMADYQRVIELVPGYARVHFNLGVSYYSQGQPDKALQSYNRAIELDANYANPHYGLAQVYFDRKEYDLARTELERTLAINRQYADAHILLEKLNTIAPRD
jgi:tetratricopeptide (TPR) repeat protein